MLLTSLDIVTQPVLNSSDGNCKLLITESAQLKTIIVTVYRPPVPNFALNKFAEVLEYNSISHKKRTTRMSEKF